MHFTYYGHATFAVETVGKHLLFDPFFTSNPLAQDIDRKAVKADYILLSHGHGDHMENLIGTAKRTGATIICAFEVAEWVKKQGYDKVHDMSFGSYTFDFGKVRYVPAWHSSSMPDGTYGANPGGFVVTTDDGSFYYSGDTCLMMDMQLIPRYAKLDFAVLPIGGNYTMDAEDATIAAEFIQCKKIIGVHYDTFPNIKIDKAATQALFSSKGCELLLPEPGQTITV